MTSTEEGTDVNMQMMKVNAVMSATAFAKFRAQFGDLRTDAKNEDSKTEDSYDKKEDS